jgi:hypothetical protein
VRCWEWLFLHAVPAACAAPPDAPADSVTHHRSEAGDANVAFTVTVLTLLHTDDDKGGRQAGMFHPLLRTFPAETALSS